MTIKEQLEKAFNEYFQACYGDNRSVSDLQLKEIRQAFFSGIHWMNTERAWGESIIKIQNALKEILGQ